MVPPLLKMAMPVLMILLIKNYFDTSDASTIFWFRVVFALGQTAVVGTLIAVYFEIPKAKDANVKLKVAKKDLEETSPFDAIWNANKSEEEKEREKLEKQKGGIIKMTVKDYDLLIWQRKFKSTIISVTMIPLLHFVIGMAVPLVMSVVLNVMGFEIPKAKDANVKLKVAKKDLEETSPFDAIWNANKSEEEKEREKLEKQKGGIIKMTVKDYDLLIWQRKFKSTIISVTMIPLLHFVIGMAVPLVMSVVLNVMGLLDDPLVRIYLRNHSPEHNKTLVRPFKFSNPMENVQKMTEQWMQPDQAQPDGTATDTVAGNANKRVKRKGKKKN
eukprot:CAMPEP_0197072932 /NCGR_PEP_ID=MMETSP1384-20130603/210346_1 /TAXON_ID=29189 /ORGANISM="Ammonia sp." /LENGTH=328 /DNA_ID=CAMNT_0042511755 /DNA_START=31 /DNA_END=1017 /DNA_ORIENTATION=-